MAITFDPKKREWTLIHREVDFVNADQVFAGETYTQVDDRRDYGELRLITAGLLSGRMVIVVWTPRGDDRHVISMRKANDREKARYGHRLGEA
jgi:uncharacterized DUF497 family protein